MHKSLKQLSNRFLIVAWGISAATLFVVYSADASIPMVAGAVAGTLAGLFQARALWATPDAFALTSSSFDVRRQRTSWGVAPLATASKGSGKRLAALPLPPEGGLQLSERTLGRRKARTYRCDSRITKSPLGDVALSRAPSFSTVGTASPRSYR